jgi:hypothetical protein
VLVDRSSSADSFDIGSPVVLILPAVVLLEREAIGGNMSDRVETLVPHHSVTRRERLVPHHSVTRREFTLEAALAILAGCVISISETGCGSDSSTPAPSPVGVVTDVPGVVSANHGHAITITAAQITAGGALIDLDIQGQATHAHRVSLSQADMGTLKNRQPVSTTSTTDASHSHTVTFTPA